MANYTDMGAIRVSVTCLAAEVVAARRFVAFDGAGGIVAVTTEGQRAAGVNPTLIDAMGKPVSLGVGGIVEVEAGAEITVGTDLLLMTGDDGRAVPWDGVGVALVQLLPAPGVTSYAAGKVVRCRMLGAASAGGSSESEALFVRTGAMGFAETLTVNIDAVPVAVITTVNEAGGNSARTGANAGKADIGGGAEADDTGLGEIMAAMAALIAAGDISPADLEVRPLVHGHGAYASRYGQGVRFISKTGAVSLATTIANTTVTNP